MSTFNKSVSVTPPPEFRHYHHCTSSSSSSSSISCLEHALSCPNLESDYPLPRSLVPLLCFLSSCVCVISVRISPPSLPHPPPYPCLSENILSSSSSSAFVAIPSCHFRIPHSASCCPFPGFRVPGFASHSHSAVCIPGFAVTRVPGFTSRDSEFRGRVRAPDFRL